jgi:hypothetical protein
VNEESFIPSKDYQVENGKYYKIDTGEQLEMIEEKNYVFKLTNEIKEEIRVWI